MTPPSSTSNMDVDYVISYRIPDTGKEQAVQQFQKLIRALAQAGLETAVRTGDESSLLVLVRAADEKVFAEVIYRSRIRDWLHGVRQIQPVDDAAQALIKEPLTESERFRHIYELITSPTEDGGAGILPKTGEWKHVESVFPLQNHAQNKKYLTEFTTKTFLTPEDLDHVRNSFGAKVGYYYAFLQSYFSFMIFPAAFGFSCWILLGSFSPIYAIVNGLWCIVFVEYWKRQERELAIRWNVKNIKVIEAKRSDFKAEKTTTDPVTGEKISTFPAEERLKRQLLQIPLALFSALALGLIICTGYAIEIFISEVYNGPFKSILVYTPTIMLTLAVPTASTYLTGFAKQLTDYENYETQAAYDQAMVSKVFVINFITSYLAILITSFVYVPFAAILVPYLDIFGLTVKPFAEHEKQLKVPAPAQFTINPNRLKNQMIYFAVTAQIVSFAMETVVPYIQKQGEMKYKEMQASRNQKASASENDPAEEKEFLQRVRNEATLPEYDVTSDLREMCMQFGYLSLFSVIWPLTPLTYFLNNWLELRADTFKLAVECRRPNPERADSIGPWLESLEFLTWFGSITSAALVYMFSGNDGGPGGRPHAIKIGGLLLSIFFSEHMFLIVRLAVRTAIAKIDSPNMHKERSERYMVRKKFLEDAGLGHIVKPLNSQPNSPLKTEFGGPLGEKITRKSLEEDARRSSLKESTPNTRFWQRQRTWSESAQTGMRLIDMMDIKGKGEKKAQ